MSKKLISHDLARMLLEQPNQVVMVNGDHAGGVTNANTWIKLGR